MSTGYHLSIGYLSGHASRDEVWPDLKAEALAICAEPQRIVAEVQRLEPSFTVDELSDYAEAYAARADLTIVIDEERREIYQSASGGSQARDIKEAMRRAMCRLLIEAMHRKGIEVNLVVA